MDLPFFNINKALRVNQQTNECALETLLVPLKLKQQKEQIEKLTLVPTTDSSTVTLLRLIHNFKN